jgi:hypothetical protein
VRITDEQIAEWRRVATDHAVERGEMDFLFAVDALAAERERADKATADALESERHLTNAEKFAPIALAQQKQLAAVRKLHESVRQWYDQPDRCKECLIDYPCDTIRVLDGDPS